MVLSPGAQASSPITRQGHAPLVQGPPHAFVNEAALMSSAYRVVPFCMTAPSGSSDAAGSGRRRPWRAGAHGGGVPPGCFRK